MGDQGDWDEGASRRDAKCSWTTRQRLSADLERLQEEPLLFASARPCSDQDLTLWDGMIGIDMEITQFGSVKAPLHFLIEFPTGYPQRAPTIGFSFDLRGGTRVPNGRLEGKQVIYQEWKDAAESGWNVAYTVTTLLVQLQCVLQDLVEQMSPRERDATYWSALRFYEENPSSTLKLLNERDLREQREQRLIDDQGTDKDICCFVTKTPYTEALLGVGISREQRNLSTAGELISQEAFETGSRNNIDGTPFEFFLPVWINETHAAKSQKWCKALRRSYMEIAREAYEVSGEDEAILEVFPRLINQMILEIMKPEAAKTAAIATFEAMCNFWRTLRWLVDVRPGLFSYIRELLSNFVWEEASRHKDNTPDLGVVLVLFTVFQGQKDCPTRNDFTKAYVDENSLRWVMWWQRSGTEPEPMPVFRATQVSREICMFQMLVVDLVIADASITLGEIEATNCKLPTQLEELQKRWQYQKSSICDWASYFALLRDEQFPSKTAWSAWVGDCVRRAADKGPKYKNGKKGNIKGYSNADKGSSKGAEKGKSAGKGAGKSLGKGVGTTVKGGGRAEGSRRGKGEKGAGKGYQCHSR